MYIGGIDVIVGREQRGARRGVCMCQIEREVTRRLISSFPISRGWTSIAPRLASNSGGGDPIHRGLGGQIIHVT